MISSPAARCDNPTVSLAVELPKGTERPDHAADNGMERVPYPILIVCALSIFFNYSYSLLYLTVSYSYSYSYCLLVSFVAIYSLILDVWHPAWCSINTGVSLSL